MPSLKALTLIFFLLSTAPAFALQPSNTEFSGAELYKNCTSKYDTDYGFCAGFVSAISNTLLTESIGGYRACNHKTVRGQQLIDLFTSYAEMFPESLNGDASIAVAATLARAFPCKE